MANLSNINNKFLFTDGDFLLIDGATANSISATESGVAIKNSNAVTLSLQNSATNGKNHTLWSNSDGSFNITDIGVATRFTIASGGDVYIPSGNVSIGNNSVASSGSNTILEIYSASVSRLKLKNSTTGTAELAGSSFSQNSDDLIISNGETSGVIQFEIGGGTPIMRMKYGGNVGIGTIFPTAKLQIENTSAGAATVAAFLVNSNVTLNTETRLAFAAHTNSDIATNRYSYISTINTSGSNGQDMIFATNATGAGGTERMRIDSSGNVSISKTDSSTYSSTTPVADLILSRKNTGNTNNETVGIRFDVTGWSGSTTGGAAIQAIQPSNASSADLAFLTRNAGTWGERMRIDSTGAVTLSAETQYLNFKKTSTADVLVSMVSETDAGSGGKLRILTKRNGDTAVNALTIDDNQNVGIGTASPSASLDIAPSSGDADILLTAGSQTLRLDQNSIRTTTNNNLTLFTNGNSGQLVLQQSTGNVGIGVTSPDFALDIEAVDSGVQLQMGRTNTSAGSTWMGSDSNGFHLGVGTYGAGNSVSDPNGFTVNTSGNVGIGETSPAEALTVVGTIRVQSASGDTDGLHISSDSNGDALINAGYSVSDLKFATADVERMRIDSNGNINIGSDGEGTGSNSTKLYGGASDGGIIYSFRDASSPGSVFRWYTGTTVVGSVSTTTSSTSFNTSSDYRLKENVVEMTGALDRISQLKPSRFNFISDADKTVDGFLAHEVQDIVPEAITGEKDGMRTEEYEVTPAVLDEEGNITEEAVMGTREVPEYQGIDQSKLVPLLVGAIQELKAEIELLKTQINN